MISSKLLWSSSRTCIKKDSGHKFSPKRQCWVYASVIVLYIILLQLHHIRTAVKCDWEGLSVGYCSLFLNLKTLEAIPKSVTLSMNPCRHRIYKQIEKEMKPGTLPHQFSKLLISQDIESFWNKTSSVLSAKQTWTKQLFMQYLKLQHSWSTVNMSETCSGLLFFSW